MPDALLPGWIAQLTHDTVIVHLKGGSRSLKGVLAAVHADCLVLRDAVVLEPETQVLLDGEVVVPRPNVDFMQRIEVSA
jgi:small nuclear ribonucleoprotein (snRNP)-like protein